MKRQRMLHRVEPFRDPTGYSSDAPFSECIAGKGADTVDVDRIILKLHGRKWRWR